MKRNILAVMMISSMLLFSMPTFAGVTHLWIDTSGSMNREGRFGSAKKVLIGEIEKASFGDILYIGSFDTNDHLIGRLVVDEFGSKAEKTKIINKLGSLSAKGPWTNLDEPLQASKAIMLDERVPGKIVILSDGLSDPSPDHQPMDLYKIAQIIPQSLGWSLYLIGLSQDIDGLFQVKSPASELTVNTEYPHVKGIALDDFTHEKIGEAVNTIKKDADTAAINKASVTRQESPAIPVPWPIILASLLLSVVGGGLFLAFRSRSRKKLELVFEVKGTDGDSKEVRFSLEDGKKKTFGPKGDIAVASGDTELPPVIFNIQWQKGILWLLPQESIAVNGKFANDKVAIGFGDLIKVREKTTILIKEGGYDNDTK